MEFLSTKELALVDYIFTPHDGLNACSKLKVKICTELVEGLGVECIGLL